MVAAGRGVAALPGWLVDEYAGRMPLTAVRLGRHGIAKQIHLGLRDADLNIDYVKAFIELSRRPARGAKVRPPEAARTTQNYDPPKRARNCAAKPGHPRSPGNTAIS